MNLQAEQWTKRLQKHFNDLRIYVAWNDKLKIYQVRYRDHGKARSENDFHIMDIETPDGMYRPMGSDIVERMNKADQAKRPLDTKKISRENKARSETKVDPDKIAKAYEKQVKHTKYH